MNYCDIVPHDKEDGSGDEVLHNQNVNVGECVDKLCSIFTDSYPPNAHKEAMAKAIIEAFPCLAINRPGCQPWSHFWSCSMGFIEMRLKTLRKKLTPSKQKRAYRSSKSKTAAAQTQISETKDDEQEKRRNETVSSYHC